MKIKTVLANTDDPERFDNRVNGLLAKGWHLVKLEVLPGMSYGANNWARRALYAELVLPEPDPVPEDQPQNPIDSLKALQNFCFHNSCEDCLLADWCHDHLPCNEGPADWEIPRREAPEA